MAKLRCVLIIPEDVYFAFVSPISQMIDNGRREKTDGVDGVYEVASLAEATCKTELALESHHVQPAKQQPGSGRFISFF